MSEISSKIYKSYVSNAKLYHIEKPEELREKYAAGKECFNFTMY